MIPPKNLNLRFVLASHLTNLFRRVFLWYKLITLLCTCLLFNIGAGPTLL